MGIKADFDFAQMYPNNPFQMTGAIVNKLKGILGDLMSQSAIDSVSSSKGLIKP